MFFRQLLPLAVLSVLVTFTSAQTVPADCSRTAIVQDGDTCDGFSARNNVSTYQLANVNKGIIESDCSNLYPGETLCLGLNRQDCTSVVVVQPYDSCSSIAAASGIPESTLLANNLNVLTDCSNLYSGEVLCILGQNIGYNGPPA